MLLTHCQNEFEKKDVKVRKDIEEMRAEKNRLKEKIAALRRELDQISDEEDWTDLIAEWNRNSQVSGELSVDLTELEMQAKKRPVATIKFIGELFLPGIIPDGIIFHCFGSLMQNTADEVAVECVLRLLVTVGKRLAQDNEKKRKMIELFRRLNDLVVSKTASIRIRCLIQDLFELAKAGWVVIRDGSIKTQRSIYFEFEKEEGERQQYSKAMHPAELNTVTNRATASEMLDKYQNVSRCPQNGNLLRPCHDARQHSQFQTTPLTYARLIANSNMQVRCQNQEKRTNPASSRVEPSTVPFVPRYARNKNQ